LYIAFLAKIISDKSMESEYTYNPQETPACLNEITPQEIQDIATFAQSHIESALEKLIDSKLNIPIFEKKYAYHKIYYRLINDLTTYTNCAWQLNDFLVTFRKQNPHMYNVDEQILLSRELKYMLYRIFGIDDTIISRLFSEETEIIANKMIKRQLQSLSTQDYISHISQFKTQLNQWRHEYLDVSHLRAFLIEQFGINQGIVHDVTLQRVGMRPPVGQLNIGYLENYTLLGFGQDLSLMFDEFCTSGHSSQGEGLRICLSDLLLTLNIFIQNVQSKHAKLSIDTANVDSLMCRLNLKDTLISLEEQDPQNAIFELYRTWKMKYFHRYSRIISDFDIQKASGDALPFLQRCVYPMLDICEDSFESTRNSLVSLIVLRRNNRAKRSGLPQDTSRIVHINEQKVAAELEALVKIYQPVISDQPSPKLKESQILEHIVLPIEISEVEYLENNYIDLNKNQIQGLLAILKLYNIKIGNNLPGQLNKLLNMMQLVEKTMAIISNLGNQLKQYPFDGSTYEFVKVLVASNRAWLPGFKINKKFTNKETRQYYEECMSIRISRGYRLLFVKGENGELVLDFIGNYHD
jgi:hypothetical protein